jgi:hypothetical protein
MPQLRGPRPDPGPGGRAKPKPKLLQKGGVRVTVEDVTNKVNKKATTDREKVLRRTGDTLKAAIAIERGKAEAHPRMGKPGALGLDKMELSPKEKGQVERTFRESLEKSAPRRGVVKPRVPTPSQGRSVARLRKPVRKATRMSGSGR